MDYSFGANALNERDGARASVLPNLNILCYCVMSKNKGITANAKWYFFWDSNIERVEHEFQNYTVLVWN